MRYYLLRQAVLEDKWRLGDACDLDNWLLIDPPANLMTPKRYTLDTRFEGREVDYSLAGYASIPVLSENAFNALSGLDLDAPGARTVFAPLDIEHVATQKHYFAMLIESQIDCVDEARSEFLKFEADDHKRRLIDTSRAGSWVLEPISSADRSATICRGPVSRLGFPNMVETSKSR